jgi:SAM-dependent methyltransferase
MLVKVGNTNIISCSVCDIHYLADFPKPELLQKYYNEDYKISNANFETEHRRISRIIEQHQLISIIKHYKPETKNVLDIGCDKGHFLDEARHLGLEVAGIELSEEAQKYCRSIGIPVKNEIDGIENRFDVVIMNHSLEHFTEPKLILQKIHLKLNENGILIVRVPAFNSFWSKLLKEKWIWFQPHNHYFHYTLQSFKFLFELMNYEILELRHRKPNNCMLWRFASITSKFFRREVEYKFGFKKKLGQLIQFITGTEILLIARKK